MAPKLQAVAGGGAWMIALSLGVVPQTWPGILRPHPYVVGFFVLTGAILFVYSAVVHKAALSQTNSVDGDNLGKMLNAQTLHYHEAPQVPLELQTPQPIVRIDNDEPQANLVDCGIEMIQASNDRGFWEQSRVGSFSAFLGVENALLMTGVRIAKANTVCAKLIFGGGGGTLTATVQKAYWLNCQGNERDISVGDKAYVVLGEMR